jgi:hypothetical protein
MGLLLTVYVLERIAWEYEIWVSGSAVIIGTLIMAFLFWALPAIAIGLLMLHRASRLIRYEKKKLESK